MDTRDVLNNWIEQYLIDWHRKTRNWGYPVPRRMINEVKAIIVNREDGQYAWMDVKAICDAYVANLTKEKLFNIRGLRWRTHAEKYVWQRKTQPYFTLIEVVDFYWSHRYDNWWRLWSKRGKHWSKLNDGRGLRFIPKTRYFRDSPIFTSDKERLARLSWREGYLAVIAD